MVTQAEPKEYGEVKNPGFLEKPGFLSAVTNAAQRLGSAAGGGTGLAGLVKPIIALHALGRMQAARPLQPVLGRFSTATVRVAID
jgi:hypothetical protein